EEAPGPLTGGFTVELAVAGAAPGRAWLHVPAAVDAGWLDLPRPARVVVARCDLDGAQLAGLRVRDVIATGGPGGVGLAARAVEVVAPDLCVSAVGSADGATLVLGDALPVGAPAPDRVAVEV